LKPRKFKPSELNETDIRQKPGSAGLFYLPDPSVPDFFFSGLLISRLALFLIPLSYFSATGLLCGARHFRRP
jgi:hypothetical protein